MSKKCPKLGASRTHVLSSCRLALPRCLAGCLFPWPVFCNVLQSRCSRHVSLAIFNLFAYSISVEALNLKAQCFTAELIGPKSSSLGYVAGLGSPNAGWAPMGTAAAAGSWAAFGPCLSLSCGEGGAGQRDTAARRGADPHPGSSPWPPLGTSCQPPAEWGLLRLPSSHLTKQLRFCLLLRRDRDIPACLCRVPLNSEIWLMGILRIIANL